MTAEDARLQKDSTPMALPLLPGRGSTVDMGPLTRTPTLEAPTKYLKEV